MRANILPTALFAALTLTAITSVRADETTFEVTWLGENDKSWTDDGVWNPATPEAWQTAIINHSSLIKFKAGTEGTVVSNIVVGANASPMFQRANSATTGQRLLVQEMNGEGTLRLNQVGIHANYQNYDTCNISVAKIEAVANGNNDSWFDGGSASGKRMVVNSDITVNGFLKVYKQTTLAGETTLAGKLLMVDEAVVVNNLVYAGDDATIDSASKGSVGRLTVRSGTLSYSALPTGVTVGSLVLDGGTLSVASDFSGTIVVAEGGGTLFLEGEWNDAASVSLPAGLSFAEGADLSKVTVQATIGESTNPAIFAIVNDNEAYSLEYVGYPFHLEELDLSWMTSGWEHPVANKSIYSISDGSYTSLCLWNGSDWQSYSKGISVQAESHLIIKLGGNGSAFSALVGLDRSADGDGRCGSKVVKFVVRDVVGGTNLVESAWLGTKTEAQTITADLSGIDFIDLVVYPDPDNGGGWQHCDWVNPTIVMKGDAAPVTRSADGTNHWTGMGENDYWVTVENWEFGVPAADATAVFDESVTVRIGQTGENSTTPEKITVSNVVVNSGATLTLRPVAPEHWDEPELIVQEVNGAGKIQLAKVGIKADYVGDRTECTVNVAEIEMLPVTRWNNEIDSWLHGKSDEGKFMVVNSTVKGTGRFYTHGNVTLNGDIKMSREFKMDSKNASAKTVILDGGWVSAENLGEIEKLVFHSGTFDYADYSDKEWPLYLDGGTVNIGDGSSIGSDGLELGVLSGGYLRYTVSEIPETGVPDFPQNLTFADGADLTTVFAIVKNSSGDAQKAYTISKSGDVYSLTELAAASEAKWVGGIDGNWQTAGNWLSGAVPVEGQAVVFERTADVRIDQSVSLPAISTLTVGTGAEVSLRYRCTSGDFWGNGGSAPVVTIQSKVTGGGTLRLQHVELVGAEGASVECAELEILPFENNDEWRDTKITGPASGTPFAIAADVFGGGFLHMYNRLALSGDNSGFAGHVVFSSSDAEGKTDRYFNAPESFFPNASKFEFYGKTFIGFTEGTARLGNVTMGESWGAAFLVKYGAQVTLEVESGSIRDTHFGDGFEVRTCAQNSEAYSDSTAGCSGLTIRKVGDGTLVYGVTKQHNLVVAEGRVEFTGENNNGDDSDVNVTVKAGASIGTPEAFSHENPNWTLGGDVTVRHQFTFEPGGAIKQEYVATTTTDEQTQVETTTYSMRRLTIADDVDLANVVFGVTNPEDLPAVTKASLANLPRFTMFAANSLSGAVATENGGYTPTGSEKNGSWIARPSRTVANAVEFRPYIRSGLAVIIK